MKGFNDKVAVITGGAGGIGRSIAARCAQEGMKIVLADIEEAALSRTAQAMESAGATVLPVVTDVSKAGDIESLANKTLDAFGGVHLLFNNAGVGGGTSIWNNTLADWEWVLGVNLWGVIHGVRTFVPIMLKQDTECHIVNTASAAGLVSDPYMGIYKVSKHAVVSLSETLYHELAVRKAKIRVSVLCPGFVSTQIMDSERNRPAEMQNDPAGVVLTPGEERLVEAFRKAISEGMPPDEVASRVFDAIREEKFYILTHPELKEQIRTRMEDILNERNPTWR